MQIKYKKQIDIELDRDDLLEAVRDLLAKHGQTVSAEELEEVRFINSPQTGIRATLKVTEESSKEPEPVQVTESAPVETAVEHAKEHIQEVGLEVVQAPVEVEAEPVENEVAPPEDVMPDLAEIAEIVAEPTPAVEEAVPVNPVEEEATAIRPSLFK